MTLNTTEQEERDRYVPEAVDEDDAEDESYPIDQYDLVSSPNDFNTKTLVDFIDSGVVIIPGFQRNYVWDTKRASRLIESIIVGLPIPQIFLYEQDRNRFLVIDGQQRLMSIYYFVKERFPRRGKLTDLRLLAEGRSNLSKEVLSNDEYFTDFQLSLPENAPGKPNRFHRERYSSLGEEYQTRFDLRTIRNIIVQQIHPKGDDAMYEIFNRLNSGGVNLSSQEIRRCMYDSKFYEMLYRTNTRQEWRKLVGAKVPDIHMKDVEILLRGFAMLFSGETYRPSMVKFLNRFSQEAKTFDDNHLQKLQQMLQSFLDSCKHLPSDAFHSNQGRFSPMIFESVFVAACTPYTKNGIIRGNINVQSLIDLKEDRAFREATQSRTSDTANVRTRLSRSRDLLIVNST